MPKVGKSLKLSVAAKIKGMKPGDRLEVETSSQRTAALAAAKSLRDVGVVDFKLHSHKTDAGKFVLIAV